MSRPLYETQEDLERERATILKLESLWDCQMVKLPIRYHLDYTIKRGDIAKSFCEVKTRSYTMQKLEEMGGYLISLGKWMAAKSMTETTGLPFVLVVNCADGTWFATFKEFTGYPVLVRGRKDRNDWQDIEPCVMLGGNLFRRAE